MIAPHKFRKLCSISECLRTWFHISNCHHNLKSQHLSVGIFFARSPSENRNNVASVASAAARFSPRFPQTPLSVISRDASARDATSFIFNNLQAAGSTSILVGRWGMRMQKRRLKPSNSEFADRSLQFALIFTNLQPMPFEIGSACWPYSVGYTGFQSLSDELHYVGHH